MVSILLSVFEKLERKEIVHDLAQLAYPPILTIVCFICNEKVVNLMHKKYLNWSTACFLVIYVAEQVSRTSKR